MGGLADLTRFRHNAKPTSKESQGSTIINKPPIPRPSVAVPRPMRENRSHRHHVDDDTCQAVQPRYSHGSFVLPAPRSGSPRRIKGLAFT
jgi:hypothetical protein